MKIERLAFFGWLWEPYHSLRLTGSYKDDKSGIDIIRWKFGGNTAQMEIEIFAIRIILLQCWKRRLYLKAIFLLKIKIQLNMI